MFLDNIEVIELPDKSSSLYFITHYNLKMVDSMNVKYWHCENIFPTNCTIFNIRFLRVIISCRVAAKRIISCWKCWVLSRYHIMHVWMIVLYIEENMKIKRYAQNVGMKATIIKKMGKSHAPPHKILTNIPVIPRIQRFFHPKELVMLQGWLASQRSDSGFMWIPIDSISMKHIEDTWPQNFKD